MVDLEDQSLQDASLGCPPLHLGYDSLLFASEAKNPSAHAVFQLALPVSANAVSHRSRGGAIARFGFAGGTILSSRWPTRPAASTCK